MRQLRTGWADGPAYITQCPIQPEQTYVYNFTLTGQRGTLWWHAHILWLRATVHGAIVILPKRGVPYPYPKPHKEVVVVLGKVSLNYLQRIKIHETNLLKLVIFRRMVESRYRSCDQPGAKTRTSPKCVRCSHHQWTPWTYFELCREWYVGFFMYKNYHTKISSSDRLFKNFNQFCCVYNLYIRWVQTTCGSRKDIHAKNCQRCTE